MFFQVDVGPLLRNSAIAFASGEDSISKIYGLPTSVRKDVSDASRGGQELNSRSDL